MPRYLCLDCGQSCSRQTFATTYYSKRPELIPRVAAALAACSAHRQIARTERCSKTTVTRIAERLGRHAMLLHARAVRAGPPPDEPVVHDHFETFVARQDRALAIGTAVGARSWFIYDLDPAPHRGHGRRPDRRPDTKGRVVANRPYVASIRRTIQGLTRALPVDAPLTLLTDGRLDYAAALRDAALRRRIVHRAYPNPKRGPKGSPRSAEAIARDNAMFPVDQLHQLLRHTCADHKRETLAFGRRLESILGRAHLIAVWKNFIKGRSERRPDRTTPAMHRGIARAPWSWDRVLSRRLFPAREGLPTAAARIYMKLWTIALPPLVLRRAG